MKSTFVSILLLLSFSVYGQQNPSSLKWNQIKTKNATIIFPQGIESQAQKVAKRVELLHQYESNTTGGTMSSLPIILYNQTTISNGYAALAPYRSVWYATPLQEANRLGSQDWLSLLAVHEYRHIAQYSSLDRNLTHLMHFLWGDYGWAVGLYSVPGWFLEGDAVCTETAMSQQGRGRLPAFTMSIRTKMLSGTTYKYDKARFGSYKDYVPNRYPLGYLITSHARQNYGKDIWANTLTRTSFVSVWPYAFSRSLKKKSGKNTRQMYDETMAEYDSLWQIKNAKIIATDAVIINKKKKKSYTSYSEPKFLADGSIICIKTSLSDQPQLVQLFKNGDEKLLGISYRQVLGNPQGGKIAFAKANPDIRWGSRDFSEVSIYDISKGKAITITQKGKFFAPALSPDGQLVAAIKFGTNLQASLVIMDLKGKILQEVLAKNNAFFRTPSWSPDGDRIVFTSSGNAGTALKIYHLKSKTTTTILAPTFENISRPVFWKAYIIYNSPYNGIGNIYAVDIESKARFQITSRHFGAYNPAVNQENMVFQDYSENGYNIAQTKLIPSTWAKLSGVKNYEVDTYSHLVHQENTGNLLDTNLLTHEDFKVTKYKRFNGFKTHSWGVIPSLNKVRFSLIGNNLLNTVAAELSSTYNNTEKTWKNTAELTFSKYFPVFNLALTRQGRRSFYFNSANDSIAQFWQENALVAGVRVPLNFSTNTVSKRMVLSTAYSLTMAEDKVFRLYNSYGNAPFSVFGVGFAYYHQQKRALRDIFPRFGYSAHLKYRTAPLVPTIKGSILSAYATGYLPGLIKNHSIRLRVAYEKQRDYHPGVKGYYYFSGNVPVARGYTKQFSDEISLLSADYVFPIWYPDFNIGSLLYIKRFRGSLFYDISTSAASNGFSAPQMVATPGLEFFAEFHVLRFSFPIELGMRYNHIPTKAVKKRFEFIAMGVDF